MFGIFLDFNMTTFAPSEHFHERWVNSPNTIKQTIYNELNDIITLLNEQTDVAHFHFTTPDLHNTLSTLHEAHLGALRQIRLAQREAQAVALTPHLEEKIDTALKERLASLSNELKDWLRLAIREEIALLDKDIH